jgi:hypothetical protein
LFAGAAAIVPDDIIVKVFPAAVMLFPEGVAMQTETSFSPAAAEHVNDFAAALFMPHVCLTVPLVAVGLQKVRSWFLQVDPLIA